MSNNDLDNEEIPANRIRKLSWKNKPQYINRGRSEEADKIPYNRHAVRTDRISVLTDTFGAETNIYPIELQLDESYFADISEMSAKDTKKEAKRDAKKDAKKKLKKPTDVKKMPEKEAPAKSAPPTESPEPEENVASHSDLKKKPSDTKKSSPAEEKKSDSKLSSRPPESKKSVSVDKRNESKLNSRVQESTKNLPEENKSKLNTAPSNIISKKPSRKSSVASNAEAKNPKESQKKKVMVDVGCSVPGDLDDMANGNELGENNTKYTYNPEEDYYGPFADSQYYDPYDQNYYDQENDPGVANIYQNDRKNKSNFYPGVNRPYSPTKSLSNLDDQSYDNNAYQPYRYYNHPGTYPYKAGIPPKHPPYPHYRNQKAGSAYSMQSPYKNIQTYNPSDNVYEPDSDPNYSSFKQSGTNAEPTYPYREQYDVKKDAMFQIKHLHSPTYKTMHQNDLNVKTKYPSSNPYEMTSRAMQEMRSRDKNPAQFQAGTQGYHPPNNVYDKNMEPMYANLHSMRPGKQSMHPPNDQHVNYPLGKTNEVGTQRSGYNPKHDAKNEYQSKKVYEANADGLYIANASQDVNTQEESKVEAGYKTGHHYEANSHLSRRYEGGPHSSNKVHETNHQTQGPRSLSPQSAGYSQNTVRFPTEDRGHKSYSTANNIPYAMEERQLASKYSKGSDNRTTDEKDRENALKLNIVSSKGKCSDERNQYICYKVHYPTNDNQCKKVCTQSLEACQTDQPTSNESCQNLSVLVTQCQKGNPNGWKMFELDSTKHRYKNMTTSTSDTDVAKTCRETFRDQEERMKLMRNTNDCDNRLTCIRLKNTDSPVDHLEKVNKVGMSKSCDSIKNLKEWNVLVARDFEHLLQLYHSFQSLSAKWHLDDTYTESSVCYVERGKNINNDQCCVQHNITHQAKKMGNSLEDFGEKSSGVDTTSFKDYETDSNERCTGKKFGKNLHIGIEYLQLYKIFCSAKAASEACIHIPGIDECGFVEDDFVDYLQKDREFNIRKMINLCGIQLVLVDDETLANLHNYLELYDHFLRVEKCNVNGFKEAENYHHLESTFQSYLNLFYIFSAAKLVSEKGQEIPGLDRQGFLNEDFLHFLQKRREFNVRKVINDCSFSSPSCYVVKNVSHFIQEYLRLYEEFEADMQTNKANENKAEISNYQTHPNAVCMHESGQCQTGCAQHDMVEKTCQPQCKLREMKKNKAKDKPALHGKCTTVSSLEVQPTRLLYSCSSQVEDLDLFVLDKVNNSKRDVILELQSASLTNCC